MASSLASAPAPAAPAAAPVAAASCPSPAPAEPQSDSLIEVDQSANDSDIESALGDDAESYTTSLKSSVLKYKFENGRRYLAYGEAYFLPNDESELNRLDLYHHVCTLRTDGKLHLAPIGDKPQRILDLGTGTGIWAIEMGEKYPSADIIGNDLSAVQPIFVPPNVRFEIDNIEEEWVYSAPFDYIHARYLAGAIRDWPALMEQAFKNTKPGGWVEFQDFEMRWYSVTGDYEHGCALDKWCVEVIEGIKSIGIDPEPGPKLAGWIKDAGFVNITHKLLPIPTGTWPKDKRLKEVGAFDLIQFLEGFEGISFRTLTNLRGYTHEEVVVLLAKLRNDLRAPRLRLQHNFHVVYAQKPLDSHT